MASNITTIRMQNKVKKELAHLKIIEQEPYESVIKRLIDCFKENLELSGSTKELLLERVKNIEEGKVMSTKEIYKKFVENKKKHKKNGV